MGKTIKKKSSSRAMVPMKQVRKLIDTAVKQANVALAASMTDTLGRAEDLQWRKLTGDLSRNLPAVTQDRMIEISYWLWKTNPLARFIIEIQTAFIVGDGIKLKAEDPKVQAVIDKFWSHPVHDLTLALEKHVRELGIFGEQCWPKFVGEFSGAVALGYQDPAYIEDVVTDPENCRIKIAVITRTKDFRPGKKYRIVLHPQVEEFLSFYAKEVRDSCDGDTYFFAVNNVTNAPRGTSDLFHRADWLDVYEQFLFDYAEKISQFNTFIWDLMVDASDQKEIDRVMKLLDKKSGSTFGHNKSVTLEAKTPDLKASESDTAARLFRNHNLGEYPEHWFGGGGDVNRATAMESGTPIFKMMSSRQLYICYILEFLGNDIIREAADRGFLTGVPKDKLKCSAEAPEMVTKDMTKFGTVISQLAASLVSMVNGEMLSRDTAIKSFAFAMDMIGFQIDPEAEKKAIEEDISADEQRDYKKEPAPGTGDMDRQDPTNPDEKATQ